MKRVLALLLALVMAVTLAACGGKDGDETTNAITIGNNDVTVGEDVTDDSTTDTTAESTELSTDSEGNKVNNKPNKKPSSLGNTTVKPSQNNKPSQVTRPTKKVYKITVTTQDGAKIVTIDGEAYNLKNADDLGALKARIEAEKANDLLGQLYDADPTIAANLGLDELDDGSVLSYKYDANGEFFYVDDINSWQQNFGFNPLYDFGAGFTVMYYDTVRIKFNYKGTGYMLQLWKGQYGLMFIGSEIGFYKKDDNTPISSTGNAALDHFDCATDHLLPMEMVCYRAAEDGTLNPLFKRKYELHWWSTGFVPGVLKNFSNRSEVVMEARITFDNAEMANIVGDTFKANGFKKITASEHNIYNPDTYYVSGSDVVFVWRYIQHKKNVTILASTSAKPTTPATTTTTQAATTTTTQAATTTTTTALAGE